MVKSRVRVSGPNGRKANPRVSKSVAAVSAIGRTSTVKKNLLAAPTPAVQFECSLDDPFCGNSYGAKVPDEYNFPTEAVTLRHRFTILNSVDGDTIVATPHPLIGSFGINAGPGTSNPGLSAISGSVTSIQLNSVVGNVNTIPVARPVSPSNFAASFVSYRVVGWGVRLRNITEAANVGGDATVAVLPCGQYAPTAFLNLLGGTVPNPGSSWNEATSAFSFPTSAYSSANQTFGNPFMSNLESLASSDTYTGAELGQTGGITIKPKIHSPGRAWAFRPAVTGLSNSVIQGTGVVPGATTQGGATTALAGNSYEPAWLDIAGHNCVVMRVTPGSSPQRYEIEVVYHLEAVSRINVATGIVPTTLTASPRVPRPVFDRVLDKVFASPWFEFAKHEGQRAIGSMIQALPGMMTKAAMWGLAA